MPAHLISLDVGNIGLKYRHSGSWTVEPSLVRVAGQRGYALVEGDVPRPIAYLSGPAHISPQPAYVGNDAERFGLADLAIVGSAEARVRSDAYLLLHLYGILASLPAGMVTATVDLAGGLPVMDAGNSAIAEILRARLKGTHTLSWG